MKYEVFFVLLMGLEDFVGKWNEVGKVYIDIVLDILIEFGVKFGKLFIMFGDVK